MRGDLVKFLNKKDLANNKIEKVADPTSETDGANKRYVDGEITTHTHAYEPAFTKNTAFNRNFGTTGASVAYGNHNHNGVYEPKNANIQSHISSISNPHGVTKSQVGLGNVDNTSDLSKPISTAQQTALANKVDKVADKGLSTNDLTTTLKTNYDNAYTHSQSADRKSVV